MGANNSTSGQVGPIPTPSTWNQVNNRGEIRKRNIPPQPQKPLYNQQLKVLPPQINPNKEKQKLKPTSNGLNLKECGTISGKKYSSEFEVLGSGPSSYFNGGSCINNTGITNGFSSLNIEEIQRNYRDISEDGGCSSGRRGGGGSGGGVGLHRQKKKKFAPPPPSNPIRKSSPPPSSSRKDAEIKSHQRIFKTRAQSKISNNPKRPDSASSSQISSNIQTSSKKESSLLTTSSNSQNIPIIGGNELRNPSIQKHYLPYSNSSSKNSQRTFPKSSPMREITETNPMKDKKCFYFGMEEENEHNKIQKNDIKVMEEYNKKYPKKVDDENSLSECSSSEMDIVIRPVLPRKRSSLPKFSPVAAWKTIELKHNSSDDELHPKYKEDIIIKNGTHEGDSGISGLDGDGCSPEIHGPIVQSHIQTSMSSQYNCWTPEQDLDESTTDYDSSGGDDIIKRRDAIHESSLSIPILTTRGNLFVTNGSNNIESIKSEEGGGGVIEPIYAQSTKTRNRNQKQEDEKKYPLNRNTDIDCNWFLSRSEPNSLNLLYDENDSSSNGIIIQKEQRITTRHEQGFTSLDLNTTENNPKKSRSLLSLSHIVYLPDSHHQIYTNDKKNRKIQSTENLLGIHTSFQDQQKKTNEKNIKKRKFKYQSTLKVLERKRIQRELERETREKEIQRLKEIETMKRVEAEFEMKRRNKLNKNIKEAISPPPSIYKINPWKNNNQSERSSIISGSLVQLSTRGDPEGAPSQSPIDLRKELILNSKKRNGISSQSSELTTELSEFKQEIRQYCDYRGSSSPKNQFNNTRNPESSSTSTHHSHRYNQMRKSTVVYPEVVADIPNKPFPYIVNFSRYPGSQPSLLIEDSRPPSGTGYNSGPSSIHSSSHNYRKDWAQSNKN